jgi:deazaflavin-dependent oxidoreductase (nitroreductase family)
LNITSHESLISRYPRASQRIILPEAFCSALTNHLGLERPPKVSLASILSMYEAVRDYYLVFLRRRRKMSELNDFNQKVIAEFRANQGKVGGQMQGMPLLLLTTTGNKTGRTITKPLAYSKDGERIFVIASFAGSPHDPAWFVNLTANPSVTVEVGTERFPVLARIAKGEERDRLFKLQADKMNIFYDYQKKTTRQIPVVVFERQLRSKL